MRELLLSPALSATHLEPDPEGPGCASLARPRAHPVSPAETPLTSSLDPKLPQELLNAIDLAGYILIFIITGTTNEA